MILPEHRRCEIIVLSQHSMSPKLSRVAVAKTGKCDVIQWRNIASNSGNSQKIEAIQFDLVEHRELLPDRMNNLFLSSNNRHSLQFKTSQTS